MGFQRYTKAEGFKAVASNKINTVLQRFGKKSVSELTDEERRELENDTEQTNE